MKKKNQDRDRKIEETFSKMKTDDQTRDRKIEEQFTALETIIVTIVKRCTEKRRIARDEKEMNEKSKSCPK